MYNFQKLRISLYQVFQGLYYKGITLYLSLMAVESYSSQQLMKN